MRPSFAVVFALLASCGGAASSDASKAPSGWVRSAGEGWEVWAPGLLVPPVAGASDVVVYKEGFANAWKVSLETLPCTPSIEQAREMLRARAAMAKKEVEADRWSEEELDVGGMAATKVRWAALGVDVITYDIVVGARVQKLEVVFLGTLPAEADSFITTHRATVVPDGLPACTSTPP